MDCIIDNAINDNGCGPIEEFLILREWLLKYLELKHHDNETCIRSLRGKNAEGQNKCGKMLKVVNLGEGYTDFPCTFFEFFCKFEILKKNKTGRIIKINGEIMQCSVKKIRIQIVYTTIIAI